MLIIETYLDPKEYMEILVISGFRELGCITYSEFIRKIQTVLGDLPPQWGAECPLSFVVMWEDNPNRDDLLKERFRFVEDAGYFRVRRTILVKSE